MEHSAATSLDSLPLLVLERICEFLARSDDGEDEPAARRSLSALWSASRACHFAADAQRFRQIQLAVETEDGLRRGLDRWTSVLGAGTGVRFRHVRRLKLASKFFAVVGTRIPEQDEEDQWSDGDEIGEDWEARHYFGMDDYFCKYSFLAEQDMIEDGQVWQPLAEFVKKLPALEDLVWACDRSIPQALLLHVETLGCRLHNHSFHLDSLLQHRDDPRPIDAADYALATSPSLSSIVVGASMIDTDGDLDYNDLAVMRMAAGASPRLAHVWLLVYEPGDSIQSRDAVHLGRPPWPGFFPGATNPDQAPVLGIGSLQSLVLGGSVSDAAVHQWSRCIDFGKLQHLTIDLKSNHNSLTQITDLAGTAIGGGLGSLDSLGLSYHNDRPQMQSALAQLFGALSSPCLQQLQLDGFLSHETLNLILRSHGATLRSLTLTPDQHPEAYVWVAGLMSFSEAVVQHLATHCPRLEELKMPVSRTHGDPREAGLYRALSRLPRLRRAFLTLHYVVGPAYADGDDIFASTSWDGKRIPRADLREALANCAVDAALARSIFDRASAGSTLRYLRLEVYRAEGRHGLGLYDSHLDPVLRWLGRTWVCSRNGPGGAVTVREVDRRRTVEAGEAWRHQKPGTLEEAFKDIWPSQAQEWWEDWKSLPLSGT